ncbi:hypothetical protein BDD12DRAFT_688941, partial [Trichophaea hybrida]
LYQKKTIPGKGIGMVATVPIPLGSLIITEQPLFTLPHVASHTLFAMKATVLHEVSKLSKDQQKAFLNLHNAQVEPVSKLPPFVSIVRTNAFGLGVNAVRSGVFDECSRFNHSCAPNAHFAWCEPTLTMHIHATRDIAEGDEITISYLSSKLCVSSHQVRQRDLLARYGFLCKCTVCAATGQDLASSDCRRSEIGRLTEEVGDGILIATNPARALKYCREILRLRDVEVQDAEKPREYYDAFQICVAHGDLARASAFMKLQLKWKEIYEGEVAEAAEMRRRMQRPEEHRLYQAVSRRWKSQTRYAREEKSEGFEEWLW